MGEKRAGSQNVEWRVERGHGRERKCFGGSVMEVLPTSARSKGWRGCKERSSLPCRCGSSRRHGRRRRTSRPDLRERDIRTAKKKRGERGKDRKERLKVRVGRSELNFRPRRVSVPKAKERANEPDLLA